MATAVYYSFVVADVAGVEVKVLVAVEEEGVNGNDLGWLVGFCPSARDIPSEYRFISGGDGALLERKGRWRVGDGG